MNWTRIADVTTLIERRWLRGDICRAAVREGKPFPWRIPLSSPSAKEMLDAFSDLQIWVKTITHYADKQGLALQWKEVNHRALGRQRLPAALLLASAAQAASLIGKRQSLHQFVNHYQTTISLCPLLQPWLLKRPVKVVELGDDWPLVVDLCLWMQEHSRPQIYLRQVSVVGIDSKWMERHRKLLAELFDLLLPPAAIDDAHRGVAGFARRYGFRSKPLMVRLRPLDSSLQLLHSQGEQDIALTADGLARLNVMPQRVVITENEINYLVFPDLPQGLMLFGSGYGFDALAQAAWLADCELFYWGDIDSHGFAILDQLRAHFPRVQSLLMDRNTLMVHQHLWGNEPKQEQRALPRLTVDERALYDDIRYNRLGKNIRLEQERIAFSSVEDGCRQLLGETR